MVSVYNVAKWFLSKQSMEHKKLQKLCYYAQAWHCALEGEPLFPEVIEAWVHGPVCPALYHQYKHYGWRDIPQTTNNDSTFTENSLEILQAVWNTYGDLTGMQLETLTHSETVWQKARGKLYPNHPMETCTNPISIEDMKTYYSDLYEKSQND